MKNVKLKKYLILILVIVIIIAMIPIIVKSAPGDPKHQYTGHHYDAYVTDISQRDSDIDGDGKIEYWNKTDLTYEHNGQPISKVGETLENSRYNIKQVLDLLNGFPSRTIYPAQVLYTFPSVFCLKYGTYIQRNDGFLSIDHQQYSDAGTSVNIGRLLKWAVGGNGSTPTTSDQVASWWESLNSNSNGFWSAYYNGVPDYFEDYSGVYGDTENTKYSSRWNNELHSGGQNVSGLDIQSNEENLSVLENNVIDNVSGLRDIIQEEITSDYDLQNEDTLEGVLENNVVDNVGGNAIFAEIKYRGKYTHYNWPKKIRYVSSNSIFRTYNTGNIDADYRSLEDVSTPYTQTSNGTSTFDVRYTATFSQKMDSYYQTSQTYGLERTQIAIWKYTDKDLESIFSQYGDDVDNEHADNEHMDYTGKEEDIKKGNALYNVNAAFVDYDKSKETYNVEVTDPDTGETSYGLEVTTYDEDDKKTGTTLKSYDEATKTATYYVGPFKMSNYAYAEAENVENFSGYDIQANNLGKTNKNLLGGIINGTLTLKDDNDGNDKIVKIGTPEGGIAEAKIVYPTNLPGTELINNTRQSSVQKIDGSGPVWTYPQNYDYPWPESTFYIELTCSIDYAYIDDISFEYRETTAEGNGWIVESKYFQSKFGIKKEDAKLSGSEWTCRYEASWQQDHNQVHTCSQHGDHKSSLIKIDVDTSDGYKGHSTNSTTGGYHKCKYKYYCNDNYNNTYFYYNSSYNIENPSGVPTEICGCKGDHDSSGSTTSSSGTLYFSCEHPNHSSHACTATKVFHCSYGGLCSGHGRDSNGNTIPHSSSCHTSHNSSCTYYDCYNNNGTLAHLHKCPNDTGNGSVTNKCRCACENGHYAEHIDYFTCMYHNGNKGTCSHGVDGDGHEICVLAYWTYANSSKYQNPNPDIKVLNGQPLLLVHDASVHVESRVYSFKTPIRLTTDICVDKYVYDVSHNIDEAIDPNNLEYNEYNYDNTLEASDDRNEDTLGPDEETKKKDNPVYAEHGDTVTYKIVFKNYQKQMVKFKVKDILPREIIEHDTIETSLDGFVNNSVAVTVNDTGSILYLATDDFLTLDGRGGSEYSQAALIVKVVVDYQTPTEEFENKAVIITRNTDDINNYDPENPRNPDLPDSNNVDYMYTVDDPNSLHGPVVNIAELTDRKLESSDWITINNYNLSLDKFVYGYEELVMDENNRKKLTDEEGQAGPDDIISGTYSSQKTPDFSRENRNTQTEDRTDLLFNNGMKDTVRVSEEDAAENMEEKKKNNPLSVEKNEKIVYELRLKNEAEDVQNSVTSTADKLATAVRAETITDYMQSGLTFKGVKTVEIHDENDNTILTLGPRAVTYAASGYSKDGHEFSKITFTLSDATLIQPGHSLVIRLNVDVDESNMYLYSLENTAEFTQIKNINDKEIDNENNLSKHQETSEYVRMKDLVIAGKVWLDFNKDGLINDKIEDYLNKNPGESSYLSMLEDFAKREQKLKEYYSLDRDPNLDCDAMMEGIIVKLYVSSNTSERDNGTLVRTTKTDSEGLYTFARDEELNYYKTHYNNYDSGYKYDRNTKYQLVDKAINPTDASSVKDEYGSYPPGTQYSEYYIEFEYDGVVYRSTAEYSGTKNLFDDGSYKTDYEIDSNAKEFKEVREKFNENYEYITYNKAYDIEGNEPNNYGRLGAYATANMEQKDTSNLEFDKTGHTSQLLVNNDRVMLARSFLEGADGQEQTKYIPLYKFVESQNTLPHTEYLKFINLGLELREDVDLSLTKDVYKVKTTIKGQDMEYNFNKNFIVNGETLSESKVNNYMLAKPYGIELYESDYKYRKDQYASVKAVEDYLGETSELNVEVTYRIRVDNNTTVDDADMVEGGLNINTPLFVKVDELVDLYDKNFIEYTEAMEGGSEEDFVRAREIDENTGRFKAEDKQIKIAEAWYYAPDEGGQYVFDEKTKLYVDTTEDASASGERYKLVPMTISNNSKKTSLNEYIGAKGYDTDGYHKLYIRPRTEEEAVIIEEGGHYDFFVKYVLEKNFEEESTITNETFEETRTKTTSSSSETGLTTGADGSATVSWYKSTESTTTITKGSKVTIDRSLILKEHTDTAMKQEYGLETENIAQVNMYSVWYDNEAKKPTSLVDRDSNAGNVGMSDTRNKTTDSADNKHIYEDTIYKTGIKISAKGTANIPTEDITEIYTGDEESYTLNLDILRKLNGHVWDDSRSEKTSAEQFIGNGLRHNGTIQNGAKKNDLVPIVIQDKEEIEDLDVPSAKAEFIEIIETDANTYYEMVPSDVMCKYRQHIRTDNDGKYELYGYAPGKYVVRFTYGDDIEESIRNGNKEQTTGGTDASQEHMYLFNGQDYKSTKYTMPDVDPTNPSQSTTTVLDDNIVLYDKANNEANIDKIIASLEAKDFNDARDDEIRRLEVNGYSEVMDNMMAEILQGKANGAQRRDTGEYLTNNRDANSPEELKALVDNTWMFAETIPFVVRAEKIDKDDPYVQAFIEALLNRTYATREQLENQLTYTREFKIENIDFGIEYRPENSVQLEKEIKEVKIVTESGETVVDLFFNTEYDTEFVAGKTTSMKTHSLNTEKSVGLDMVQFISNEYEINDLVSKLITENSESNQGFVFINYDVDIQQGATIEITYEFIAENHGEEDRISKNLDNIRYQTNPATTSLSGSVISNVITGSNNENGTVSYKANITAANDMINNLYERDAQGIFFRKSPKVLTATDGTREPAEKVDANGASRNKLSYYGYYEGYSYYTGEITDFDTVAELKFNKILDYVDKDMLYLDNTKGKESTNKTWSILDNTYKEYYSTIDWARSNPTYIASLDKTSGLNKDDILTYVNDKIKALNIVSAYKEMQNDDGLTGSQIIKTEIGDIKGASIDPEGFIYENMLISTDTGMYTDIYVDSDRTLISQNNIPDGTNPSLSRFLMPMVSDTEEYSSSRGKIDLTVSKAISAETSDDELEYQNIAEIVEFTTLTGRRTNFAITIGNVDVRPDDPEKIPNEPNPPTPPPTDPNNPDNPKEYDESTPEPDESTAEVVTLIPPQGLYGTNKVIREVVEIAKTGSQVVVIIVAIATVGLFGTTFAIRKYNKRRIK